MTKKRISLTLDEDLLTAVDRYVGNLSESRSGVFEVFLQKALLSMVPKTAVILAGSGKENTVMDDFEGKKVIDRHLDGLGLAGVNKFIFIGSNLDSVKDYTKGKEGEFRFVDDKESGTAGALREAEHIIKNTFFLVYGDTMSGIDYADLYRFHSNEKVMMTVALTTSSEPQKLGVPKMKGTRVEGFKEKPSRTESHLVSAGAFVVEPEVLEMVPSGKSSLETRVLPKLASINQLAGYLFSGKWVDLGLK